MIFAFYLAYLPRDKRGTVFAAIESTNIVGYQNKESLGNSYFKFVVPTFNTVSNSDLKLADIKLNYDGDDASSQNIWTLTLGGATKQAYYYVNEEAADLEGCEVGWYSDNWFTKPANDVTIPFGQGFALVTADDTTSVVFAGQVESAEAVTMIGGSIFNFTGNFMPVDCSLADIALIYAGDDASSQNIWTLTLGGATKQAYYYANEEAADLEGCEVGWYSDNWFTKPANDVVLKAGDGFAVVAADAIQVLIPSPITSSSK